MSWKPEPRLEITVNHSALPDELDVKFNYVEPTTVVSKIRSAISKVNNLFGYVVAAALTVLALSWMIPLKGFFELSLALAIVFVFVYVMLLLMVFSEEKDGATSVKFRAKVGEEEVVNTSVLRSTLFKAYKETILSVLQDVHRVDKSFNHSRESRCYNVVRSAEKSAANALGSVVEMALHDMRGLKKDGLQSPVDDAISSLRMAEEAYSKVLDLLKSGEIPAVGDEGDSR